MLPTDKHGRPLAASNPTRYYHPKEGLSRTPPEPFGFFRECVNDSATALEDNYESFMVFQSWDGTQAHLAQIGHRFNRLWDGKERDWIAMPIPEAARQKLLKLRPAVPPTEECGAKPSEPEEPPADDAPVVGPAQRVPAGTDRISVLRDVPHLPNADRLGMETCTVSPWPHQPRVADTIVQRFPSDSCCATRSAGENPLRPAWRFDNWCCLASLCSVALIWLPKSVLDAVAGRTLREVHPECSTVRWPQLL